MSSPTKHADGSAPTQEKKKNIYDSNRKKKNKTNTYSQLRASIFPKNTFHILMAYNFTFRSHNHTKRRFILYNRLEKR